MSVCGKAIPNMALCHDVYTYVETSRGHRAPDCAIWWPGHQSVDKCSWLCMFCILHQQNMVWTFVRWRCSTQIIQLSFVFCRVWEYPPAMCAEQMWRARLSASCHASTENNSGPAFTKRMCSGI